jgi:DNA-binding response OmpR family regulator
VPASPSVQAQTNLPARILVVEDNRDIRCLSAEMLSRHGYEVDTAKDGAAAWEALMADEHDLMITDNNMPNVSGVELLKKLHAARMALPVIMATGTLPTEEFTRYPWLQLTAILLKPYSSDELLGTVREVLRVTDTAGGQVESLPDWRSQPSAVGFRL